MYAYFYYHSTLHGYASYLANLKSFLEGGIRNHKKKVIKDSGSIFTDRKVQAGTKSSYSYQASFI